MTKESKSKDALSVEQSAVDAVVTRTEVIMAKLKNGAGKVEACPAHEVMAQAVVCIGEMLIPVYRHVAEEKPLAPPTSIKTKWFTADGAAAMLPVAAVLIAGIVCYTLIRLKGGT
jgi:hypothetical protein